MSGPVVDASLMRLARHETLPHKDAVTFRDVLDRKIDLDLKRAYAAAGRACRPAIALAAVGRAISSWTSNVEKLILDGAEQERVITALQELSLTGLEPGRVGARKFTKAWAENIRDPWTVATVQFGQRWKFKNRVPKDQFYATRLPASREKRMFLVKYIQDFLQKRAIVEVPLHQRGKGFYFPLFLVKNKTGDLCPVLDLKESQQENNGGVFQDGKSSINPLRDKSGRLDAICRFIRRISSRAHTRYVPKIPIILSKT